ncbi:hypothetical protein [Pelistega sp. MC2]|uniref:hypothetical protein n=1 Tax=Pelistega sp. MC2 TaxID=1720297 RepID=UPI0008DA0359|nr:hypothetical protein [Pelistega sp. MC2]
MLSVSSTVAVLAAANASRNKNASRHKTVEPQEIEHLTESELLNEAGKPLNETERRIKEVDLLLKEFREKEAKQDGGDIVVTIMMIIFISILLLGPVILSFIFF